MAVTLGLSASSAYNSVPMKKLPEVDEAKALMAEAMEWSVFTWLFQKGQVRETADRANAVLDKLKRTVKSRWGDDVKAAYAALEKKTGPDGGNSRAASEVAAEITLFVKKVKRAEDSARRARVEAEETFDRAESELNTALAREGCRKAIRQWELDERAIRQAEAAPGASKAEP